MQILLLCNRPNAYIELVFICSLRKLSREKKRSARLAVHIVRVYYCAMKPKAIGYAYASSCGKLISH